MTRPVAVLDANVLIPFRLVNTLLWLAEAGVFQALWSDEILEEVERNLPKLGITPEKARRRVRAMREGFGSAALVDDFDHLVPHMECDPKDRHVLAAAVRAEADTLVTFNLKDFPEDGASARGVRITDPDTFLTRLLHDQTGRVLAGIQKETAAFRRPPETPHKFLATLTDTVPMFANLAADALGEPPGSISPVPALVAVDPGRAVASLGDLSDLSDPAQVASHWWIALLEADIDMARLLTHHPPSWGDYQWAIDHLAGRSLASKVIPAVDAPDQIAFMRFVPEVATASQVFRSYVTEATILTMVRIQDGTWRVRGLGPAMASARAILGD